jgi:uncharacterized protein YutE (UPF0331/DUF86 family)
MTLAPERAERIVDKAEHVERSLTILAEKQSLSREAYLDDREQRDVVERRFVTMTQACVDMARLLLGGLGEPIPDSSSTAMSRLIELDVLTETTGNAMIEACGLRNVLAHEYWTGIDDEKVYSALQNLERYREFLVELRAYLEAIDAL